MSLIGLADYGSSDDEEQQQQEQITSSTSCNITTIKQQNKEIEVKIPSFLELYSNNPSSSSSLKISSHNEKKRKNEEIQDNLKSNNNNNNDSNNNNNKKKDVLFRPPQLQRPNIITEEYKTWSYNSINKNKSNIINEEKDNNNEK